MQFPWPSDTSHWSIHVFSFEQLKLCTICMECCCQLFTYLLLYVSCFLCQCIQNGAKRRPTTKPNVAPSEHEMGHTCQGLSQSSGIGNAPSQVPKTLQALEICRLLSQMDKAPFLLKTRIQVCMFGPRMHRQRRVVNVDIRTASKNVSSTDSSSGAPYRQKIV